VRLYSGSVASTNLVAGPVNPVSTITPAVGAYVDFNGGFKTGGGLTASSTGGTSLSIPKDTIKTIVVTAETNSYLNGSSGQTHIFSLQASPQLTTRAITSAGAVTSTAGNGPTSNTNIANTYEIRRNYPIVAPDTGSLSTTLSNGSGQTVYKFKVTAPSTGDEVRIKKMAFQVVMTDTTTTSGVLALSTWQLKRNGSTVTASDYRLFNGAVATTSAVSSLGGTATIAGCSSGEACDDNESDGLRAYNAGVTGTYTTTGTTTSVVLVFATEESISAGSTNSYELVATIANVSTASGDSDSVAISILGDSSALGGQRTGNVAVTQLAPAGGFGVSIGGAAATAANFVWSDLWQGVTAHGTPTADTGTVTVGTDWTNAFLVPETVTGGVATDFLPTGQFLKSK
ncbi:MAG: hypothetical protein Q8R13_04450, partial [bacterium]|nr:hypothetical protein [bacterium]